MEGVARSPRLAARQRTTRRADDSPGARGPHGWAPTPGPGPLERERGAYGWAALDAAADPAPTVGGPGADLPLVAPGPPRGLAGALAPGPPWRPAPRNPPPGFLRRPGWGPCAPAAAAAANPEAPAPRACARTPDHVGAEAPGAGRRGPESRGGSGDCPKLGAADGAWRCLSAVAYVLCHDRRHVSQRHLNRLGHFPDAEARVKVSNV